MNDTREPIPAPAARWKRALIPAMGFLLSLGAMGWAVSAAFSPKNRGQLDHLRDASPLQLISMMALAAVSVGLNGVIFWVTIHKLHKIRLTDVISTNAIATFLAYLPFKLSVIVRVAIHNRRDRVPLITIGAWFACVGALMLITLAPITIASIWIKDITLMWWMIAIGGVALCTIAGSSIARFFAGDAGRQRLGRLPIPSKWLVGDGATKALAGFEMLGDYRAATVANTARLLDVLAFAGRFMIAAAILQLPISAADALLLGGTYFLIGVLSPFGQIGIREAGTIGFAALVGISDAAAGTDPDSSPIALAVVFVTAVEGAVNLVCAGFGVVWLRVDRLLRTPQAGAYDTDE